MRPAYRWLVDDWQWPYAATLTGVVLLFLVPILWDAASPALALVFLQLPVYMLHQFEEHAGDRFRRFINSLFDSDVAVLTRGAVFWVNSLLVWALFLLVLLLAQFADLAFGLIAVAMTGVNALIHLIAAAARRGYNPGLYTAILLMVPAAIWAAAEIAADADPSAGYLILAVAVAVVAHAALLAFGLRRGLPRRSGADPIT